MTELTASQARYETIIALSKDKNNVEEYETVLDKIHVAAKQGKVQVSVRNLCAYSLLCLIRDGFSIEKWDHDYTIKWAKI